MTAANDLLPCPFCGGEAGEATVTYSQNTVDKQQWDQSTFYYCNCIRCGVSNVGLVGHHTPELAAAAWNRRLALTDKAGG